MKLIIVALGLLLLSACEQVPTDSQGTEVTYKTELGENKAITIMRFDGCQYLRCRTHYGYYVLTHKGNCDNPMHTR